MPQSQCCRPGCSCSHCRLQIYVYGFSLKSPQARSSHFCLRPCLPWSAQHGGRLRNRRLCQRSCLSSRWYFLHCLCSSLTSRHYYGGSRHREPSRLSKGQSRAQPYQGRLYRCRRRVDMLSASHLFVFSATKKISFPFPTSQEHYRLAHHGARGYCWTSAFLDTNGSLA